MLAQVFARCNLAFATKFARRFYTTNFGDHCPLVITPAQLQELRANDRNGSDLVVLDASWHMPNSPRKGAEEFLRVHLPSARFIDVDEVASSHPLALPHMLPDPTTFANACGKHPVAFSAPPNRRLTRSASTPWHLTQYAGGIVRRTYPHRLYPPANAVTQGMIPTASSPPRGPCICSAHLDTTAPASLTEVFRVGKHMEDP